MSVAYIASFFIGGCALAAIAILSRLFRPWFYAITKPQPMVFMIAMAVLFVGPRLEMNPSLLGLIALGAIFGLIGDIFLLRKQWFIPGFVSFLLGHVLYIIAFFTLPVVLSWYWVALLYVPTLIYAPIVQRLATNPHVGKIIWPYAIMENTMLIAALNADLALGTPPFLTVGAALFSISDGFWSWNKFVRPIPSAGLYILSTYYTGQMGILFGAMYIAELLSAT